MPLTSPLRMIHARKEPTESVQDMLKRLSEGQLVSKDINQIHEERLTFGQRVSDRLASVVGSWTFIIAFLLMVAAWIVINTVLLVTGRAWDPYPYILLNLILSLLAGIQAPAIMMSQNRQEAKDRLHADHDYEVNLKAELGIEQLHLKMDMLREGQWKDLVAMQQRQIEMLERQIKLLENMQPGS